MMIIYKTWFKNMWVEYYCISAKTIIINKKNRPSRLEQVFSRNESVHLSVLNHCSNP